MRHTLIYFLSSTIVLLTQTAMVASMSTNQAEWFKEHQDEDGPCSVWADRYLYDFSNLKNMEKDWSVTTNSKGNIHFNFCHYVNQKSCPKVDHDAFGISVNFGECYQLTSDAPRSEVLTVISRPSPEDG